MPSNHLILSHPLLLPPSVIPSIRVFSNESVLRIRWPKYCSLNFSISASNEYSRLIFFRIDYFDLLAVQADSGKDPDDWKDGSQEEKGGTEDEMIGQHHRLNRQEFEQTPGAGEGRGSLVYCSPWGCKELDMTE